ncbi:MAG: transcription antitermination factor NusB [Phycisphaerales bacterium]
MGAQRDIRRCALQALYQFETGRADALTEVRASLHDSPGDARTHDAGFDLATRAWEFRDEADAAITALAEDWPIYRQPVLDRSILRLAWYEMHHTQTPPKVVVNEAVELAREFSTEKSHLFINGVLDKILKSLLKAQV